MDEFVTAQGMASEAGVSPKTFRAALRREEFDWHAPSDLWTVLRGSREHEAMQRVLNSITPTIAA
jgi:hypothetical protein